MGVGTGAGTGAGTGTGTGTGAGTNDDGGCPGATPGHPPCSVRDERYLTLPAVRPPTRRFSMSMNSTTTGMIATIETPKT